MISWSPSRVDDFEGCPKRMYHRSVAKRGDPDRVEGDPQTAEQKQGDVVHKMLEYRVSRGQPLPQDYQRYEPTVAAIAGAPGKTLTELELAIDYNLAPCGYKDWDRAYGRVKADILKLNGGLGFAGDYKTGKPKFDEFQLKLTAAVLFVTFPELEQVTTAYIWLNHGPMIDPATYHRSALATMWDNLLVVPRRIQECEVMGNWPARPGRHCSWCPVNREKKCQFAQQPYKAR